MKDSMLNRENNQIELNWLNWSNDRNRWKIEEKFDSIGSLKELMDYGIEMNYSIWHFDRSKGSRIHENLFLNIFFERTWNFFLQISLENSTKIPWADMKWNPLTVIKRPPLNEISMVFCVILIEVERKPDETIDWRNFLNDGIRCDDHWFIEGSNGLRINTKRNAIDSRRKWR